MKPRKRNPSIASEPQPSICPVCGKGALAAATVKRVFDHGVGEAMVTAAAMIDVLSCAACGAEIDTTKSLTQMEDAGRRASGMLVGDDFRQFRQRLGLSLRDMSRLTGIGTATLHRWELGRLRPNRSLDLLMRLLRDVDGAAAYALRAAHLSTGVSPGVRGLRREGAG